MLVESGRESAQAAVTGGARRAPQRPPGDPVKEHAATRSWHAGGPLVDVVSAVRCAKVAADVEPTSFQRSQPRELVVDVGVRVLLVKVDAKREGASVGVDPEDHVSEAAHEPQTTRLDTEALQRAESEVAQTPDLTDLRE